MVTVPIFRDTASKYSGQYDLFQDPSNKNVFALLDKPAITIAAGEFLIVFCGAALYKFAFRSPSAIFVLQSESDYKDSEQRLFNINVFDSTPNPTFERLSVLLLFLYLSHVLSNRREESPSNKQGQTWLG